MKAITLIYKQGGQVTFLGEMVKDVPNAVFLYLDDGMLLTVNWDELSSVIEADYDGE